MIRKLQEILTSMVKKTFYLNYGREIITNWCKEYIQELDSSTIKILDIGCGKGTDLMNIKEKIKNRTLKLFGIEYYEQYVKEARKKGINVFQIDIEREPIPVDDEFFDIVIANQIIEHTKEIFWIFSEISRTLKKGGILIVGFPNLASLHNRIMLLFGKQPSSIEILGPHVRGFTAPGFKKFVETDGFFKVLKIRGSNFYPFPSSIAQFLSKLFPTLSVSLFFLIKRQDRDGRFIQVLDTRFYETAYFRG